MTSEPDATVPITLTQAGDYDLVRKLGAGGFGVVWEARHRMSGLPYALKRLHLSPDDAKRIRDEAIYPARIASQSVHVMGVHSFFHDTVSDTFCLVTELIPHGDLRAFLDRHPKPLPLVEALSIGIGIAKGLAAIHAQQIIHRDLKPANVLMDRKDDRWVPKIADFGLARSTGSVSLGEFATSGYAAPEQLDLMATQPPGPDSDLFSFGMILHELLTGQKPTRAQDLREYAQWLGKKQPPAVPSSVRAELAAWPALDVLAASLLVFDRAQRTSKASDVVRVLTQVLQQVERAEAGVADTKQPLHPAVPAPHRRPDPITPPTVRVLSSPPLAVKGHRWRTWSLAAGVLAVLVALLVWMQSPVSTQAALLITTDMPAYLSVDGSSEGEMTPGQVKRMVVAPFMHTVTVTSTEEDSITFEQSMDLKSGDERTVAAALKDRVAALRRERAETEAAFVIADDTVLHRATGLEWARSDNGAGITWNDANGYCDALLLGGQSDWRLPSAAELQALYRVTEPLRYLQTPTGPWKAVPGIRASSTSFWSSTPDNVWYFLFDFHFGQRSSMSGDDRVVNRALCVRRASGAALDPVAETPRADSDSGAATQPVVDTGDTVLHTDLGLERTARDTGLNTSWLGARPYCNGLIRGGWSDWRLPTIDELEAIVRTSADSLKATGDYDGRLFWSSTESGAASALGIRDGTRMTAQVLYNQNARALCVRRANESPAARTAAAQRAREADAAFLRQWELTPDTVLHRQTGLEWARRDNGSAREWPDATAYCDRLMLGGRADWQLPTVEELEALYGAVDSRSIEITTGEVLWHPVPGVDATGSRFWSSTRNGASDIMAFSFYDGKRNSLRLESVTGTAQALCVRRPNA